jgi:hypothetical protein
VEGGSRYDQRAVFFPRGLAGRLYWLAVLPFHGFIFAGMASRIAATAEASGWSRGGVAASHPADMVEAAVSSSEPIR